MFSICRRLGSVLKLKTTVTVFVLLLITLAFTNFFILYSLQTNVHHKRESLLASLFLIHIHKNVTVFERESEQGNSDSHQFLARHPRKEMEREDALIATNMKIDKESSVKPSERKSQNGIQGNSDGVEQLVPKKAGMTSRKNKISTSLKPRNKISPQSNTVLLTQDCTAWCHRGNGLKPPYLLTAVLLVRIYRKDLAKLSSREMLQWLHYLRYAGFQHVYVYDAYVKPSESQRDVIQPFVQSGFATYIDWSVHNPYSIQGTQVAAYQDCINKFGKDSTWQAAIDIDEYPFSPSDLDENFMSRFLAKYSRTNPDVSEITMKNYLFLGKPLDDASEPLLIARIRRRTHEPANALVKPIYKPVNIGWAQVHHNGIKTGSSMDSPTDMLRMNHYWGARLQDWGEDTPKILEMTRPDYSIEPIVARIKQCASCLGSDSLSVVRWA